MNLAERLGHSNGAKLLVLHADDMGSNEAANLATFELMGSGRLTSGSVIMPGPNVQQVADYQGANPGADLGVHLTLTSEHPKRRWPGVLGPQATPSLHDGDGFLPMTVAEVVSRSDPDEAARELRAQVELALELGIDVTHLDFVYGRRLFSPVSRGLGRPGGGVRAADVHPGFVLGTRCDHGHGICRRAPDR